MLMLAVLFQKGLGVLQQNEATVDRKAWRFTHGLLTFPWK